MIVPQSQKTKQRGFVVRKNVHDLFFLAVLLSAVTAAEPVLAGEGKPLWLSLAPAKPSAIADAVTCAEHTPPAVAEPAGRPANKPTGTPRYGQGAGKPPRFESEHRPMPKRSYWLNLNRVAPGLTVSAMRADGSPAKVEVQPTTSGLQLLIDTPMGDGPAHGANNIYAVDRQVVDNVLVIRNAKWLTIHHNCGWGHDHKFDAFRQTSHAAPDIPLEIVVDDLWDTNFHSRVMSGDELHIRILNEGQGVPKAQITVTSDKGWRNTLISNEYGAAKLQLIRDYYPANWLAFDRDTQSAFTVEAVYEKPEQGMYRNTPYNKVRMSSTFSWRYYPARQEYNSYAWGLGIALVFSLGGGAGVYAYRERRKRPVREIVFDE